MGDSMLLLIVGAVAILVSLGLLLLATGVPKSQRRTSSVRPAAVSGKEALGKTSDFLVNSADDFLKRSTKAPISERDLELAGIRSTPGSIMVFVVTMMVVLFLIFGVVLRLPLLGLIAAILPALGTKLFINFKLGKRRKAFASQLDETLQVIASALRAGHSFPASIDAVAQGAGDPTGPEFARIVNENRIGRDLIQAMNQTADRMESTDFRWVTEAVATHRETGGNLNQIIDRVATTIRERKQLREEVFALSAEGRFSGIVLMAVPIVVGGLLFAMNPSYMMVMFTTFTGQMVLLGSLVMYVVAGVWINKIVKVDF